MLRLIGDIHGKRDEYLSLVQGADCSLQVGDLDLAGYDWLSVLDADKHKFIGGNHDNYNLIDSSPHCLGDFGIWSVPNFGEIFFVRGAWSIDQKRRTIGKDWWPDEELSYNRCLEAIDLYNQLKPKILVSHTCSAKIAKLITDPQRAVNWGFYQATIQTRTEHMLDMMLEQHAPELHVFGHHHKHFDETIDGTRHVCLPIFGTIDL